MLVALGLVGEGAERGDADRDREHEQHERDGESSTGRARSRSARPSRRRPSRRSRFPRRAEACWSSRLPSAIAIAPVTSRIPTRDAATVARRTPIQPATPNGSPCSATVRKTITATDVVSASCARLKTNLAARWRRTNARAAAAPASWASEQPPGREEVEAEHEPDLAQRDRVRLAPELHVDDVRLGEVEDERERPPGHRGGKDRRAVEAAEHLAPERETRRDQKRRCRARSASARRGPAEACLPRPRSSSESPSFRDSPGGAGVPSSSYPRPSPRSYQLLPLQVLLDQVLLAPGVAAPRVARPGVARPGVARPRVARPRVGRTRYCPTTLLPLQVFPFHDPPDHELPVGLRLAVRPTSRSGCPKMSISPLSAMPSWLRWSEPRAGLERAASGPSLGVAGRPSCAVTGSVLVQHRTQVELAGALLPVARSADAQRVSLDEPALTWSGRQVGVPLEDQRHRTGGDRRRLRGAGAAHVGVVENPRRIRVVDVRAREPADPGGARRARRSRVACTLCRRSPRTSSRSRPRESPCRSCRTRRPRSRYGS